MVGGPHVTFSGDLQHAFVEKTAETDTPEKALGVLEEHLGRDEDVRFAGWTPNQARVTAIEHWDENAGERHPEPTTTTRTLWRVDISKAVEHREPSGDDGGMLRALVAVRDQIDEATWNRLEILQAQVDLDHEELAARQASRPRDAPRAYFTESQGRTLACLAEAVTTALANAFRGSDPSAAAASEHAAAELRGKLRDDEERQITQLREQLGP